MIRSGIAPLDATLGGLLPGRFHLLTGGVGTGKTTACLHFLAAGLESGEAAALLTHDAGGELHAHADYIGLDFNAPMRAGRFVALRYRPGFTRQVQQAPTFDWVIDDLQRLLRDLERPFRMVIDPLTPFLRDGSSSGEGLHAITELLEQPEVTALLTFPGAISDGADRRLDALVERAATIVECTDVGDEFQMRIARARSGVAPRSPLPFRIIKGAGIVHDDAGAMPPAMIQIASGP